MPEIRLCWRPEIVHYGDDPTRHSGAWLVATPESRSDIEIIMASANEVYGAGSHWIEEREFWGGGGQ
jgi:alkanesulfonate monooxygenase SsuD/methylene tetrahydromethanopterin reductase-like flavin-dependent oxidoreductase (luciferase family)